MNSEIASVYESEKFDSEERVVPFKELNPQVLESLAIYCNAKKIRFNKEDRTIFFNDVQITYYLYYSPAIRRYFLCFQPKNVWTYSSKKVLLPAFHGTIEFFNALKSQTTLGGLQFFKSALTGEVDISNWKFATLDNLNFRELRVLSYPEISRISNAVYRKKARSIDKKLIIVDASNLFNSINVNSLKNKVKTLFKQEPELVNQSSTTLEQLEVRHDKSNLFVLFIGNSTEIKSCYREYKKHFIANNIPSQFVSVEKLPTILKYGFENFIFEIIKKILNEDAIFLETISTNVDGYLCLSDIGKIETTKLFGISMTFSGKGTSEDFLEIYNDIDYTTQYEKIYFEEGQLLKLSQKINALSNLKGKTVDVFVSRRWKVKDVGYLSRLLEKLEITVGRFLYIGSKANRFLFSSLSDENKLLTHPYIIWDDRAASIQTNSKIQLYGTMFPVYVELLNPWNDRKLADYDIRNILWLVKKRIYRINNFYNLKSPEIVSLFGDVKDLSIKDIPGKLRIGVHYLL